MMCFSKYTDQSEVLNQPSLAKFVELHLQTNELDKMYYDRCNRVFFSNTGRHILFNDEVS